MQKHIEHNKDERRYFFRKYTSHFIWQGSKGLQKVLLCERWVGDWTELQHIDPTLMAITAFLSRFPGLLNRGPGGPISLEHDPHSSIFSPTDLNFLSPGLYNNLTSTYFLRASEFHSIQPLDSQGRTWSPDIFDWMHLLFTLVHIFFWQLGQVGGQYATISPFVYIPT